MKAITKSKGFIPADNSDRTVMLQLKMGKQIEHSTQNIARIANAVQCHN